MYPSKGTDSIVGCKSRMSPLTSTILRMRLPGEKVWSPGICAGLVGPRSYKLQVWERNFERNCRHLIKSEDVVVEDRPELQDIPDRREPVRVSQETFPAEEHVQPHLDSPQTSGATPEQRLPHYEGRAGVQLLVLIVSYLSETFIVNI